MNGLAGRARAVTADLMLRSGVKRRVSKHGPDRFSGSTLNVLRGRFAAPQDEGAGLEFPSLALFVAFAVIVVTLPVGSGVWKAVGF